MMKGVMGQQNSYMTVNWVHLTMHIQHSAYLTLVARQWPPSRAARRQLVGVCVCVRLSVQGFSPHS